MADSHSGLPPFKDDDNTHEGFPNIPVEIVSDEEMALIEAALAAAVTTSRSSSSVIHSTSCSSHNLFNTRSIHSITLLSKRGIDSSQPDIEDLGKIPITQKKIKVNESLLQRFKRNKPLAVTDITRMVWTSCCASHWFCLWLFKRSFQLIGINIELNWSVSIGISFF